MSQTQLKMYDVCTVLAPGSVTGSGQALFSVLSGARMLLTLLVTAIDAGTTVQVFIDDSFDTNEAYENIDSLSALAPGQSKKTISGFNNLIRLRYVVSGGNATFKVAAVTSENARACDSDYEDVDGGKPDSVYGGTLPFDGGKP